MDKIYKGKVEGGKFRPMDPRGLASEFTKRDGKFAEVIVRTPKKWRSNPENKYYWAVPIPLISEATGNTKEETHLALRVKFLTDESGSLPRVRSTTELTTIEFEEYMTQIRQFGAEFLDLYVPEPNEVDYEGA